MFSVIIPYFNKAKYIERCINSVLEQTYTNFEVIIVNDGSTDSGLNFISNINHSIKIINQENKGVSEARNTGIKNAEKLYIAFLDADDFWHKEYLKNVAEVINKEKQVKIIGSHYTRNKNFIFTKSKNLNYIKFNNYFKSALRNTYFTASSTVIAKHFFTTNTGFNSNLKSGEDIDVWIRTVLSKGNAFYIKNTLVYYSNEDKNQATNSSQILKNTLLGNINYLYNDLLITTGNNNFKKFVAIYVYFNLYSSYFDKDQHKEAKLILKHNKKFYFLLHLVYFLPFSFGKKLVQSKKYNKVIRLYLKFIIRYIYTL